MLLCAAGHCVSELQRSTLRVSNAPVHRRLVVLAQACEGFSRSPAARVWFECAVLARRAVAVQDILAAWREPLDTGFLALARAAVPMADADRGHSLYALVAGWTLRPRAARSVSCAAFLGALLAEAPRHSDIWEDT
jgi:hypothetical protein